MQQPERKHCDIDEGDGKHESKFKKPNARSSIPASCDGAVCLPWRGFDVHHPNPHLLTISGKQTNANLHHSSAGPELGLLLVFSQLICTNALWHAQWQMTLQTHDDNNNVTDLIKLNRSGFESEFLRPRIRLFPWPISIPSLPSSSLDKIKQSTDGVLQPIQSIQSLLSQMKSNLNWEAHDWYFFDAPVELEAAAANDPALHHEQMEISVQFFASSSVRHPHNHHHQHHKALQLIQYCPLAALIYWNDFALEHGSVHLNPSSCRLNRISQSPQQIIRWRNNGDFSTHGRSNIPDTVSWLFDDTEDMSIERLTAELSVITQATSKNAKPLLGSNASLPTLNYFAEANKDTPKSTLSTELLKHALVDLERARSTRKPALLVTLRCDDQNLSDESVRASHSPIYRDQRVQDIRAEHWKHCLGLSVDLQKNVQNATTLIAWDSAGHSKTLFVPHSKIESVQHILRSVDSVSSFWNKLSQVEWCTALQSNVLRNLPPMWFNTLTVPASSPLLVAVPVNNDADLRFMEELECFLASMSQSQHPLWCFNIQFHFIATTTITFKSMETFFSFRPVVRFWNNSTLEEWAKIMSQSCGFSDSSCPNVVILNSSSELFYDRQQHDDDDFKVHNDSPFRTENSTKIYFYQVPHIERMICRQRIVLTLSTDSINPLLAVVAVDQQHSQSELWMYDLKAVIRSDFDQLVQKWDTQVFAHLQKQPEPEQQHSESTLSKSETLQYIEPRCLMIEYR